MMPVLIALCLLQQSDFEKRLDELIPRLQSERIEVRDRAQLELQDLAQKTGAAARAPLRARIAKTDDAALKTYLLSTIRRLPTLALRLEVGGEPRVGAAVKFNVRIRNIGDEPVSVVRVLDGSDSGHRFPRADATFLGPDGKIRPVDLFARMCPNCWRIREEDVTALKPGEEFDPVGTRRIQQLWEWKPAETGKHSVTLKIDYSEWDPAMWNALPEREEMDKDKATQMLAGVPRVKLEAKLEFVVKP